MENIERVDVIGKYRPYLNLLKAFNAVHTDHCDNWRAWLERHTRLLYTSVLVVAGALATIFSTWGLFDKKFALRETAAALPLIISCLQITVSFISLALKNRRIGQVLDGVQALIDKRKTLVRYGSGGATIG